MSRRLLLFAIVIAISIVPGLDWSYVTRGEPPLKWNGSGVYFLINFRVPIDPEDFRTAIGRAAAAWNGYTNWYFSDGGLTNLQFGSPEGYSVFDYLGFPDSPDSPGLTIPTEYANDPSRLYEVDSCLNFALPLSTLADPFSYDVQSIAVHEFGHWLFLDDTDVPGPVMYGHLGEGQLRRALDQDDIDGLRFLYSANGIGGSNPPSGQCNNCRRILACTICEPCVQPAPSMTLGMHQKAIESLGESIRTMSFERPGQYSLLYPILGHLPEVERIAAWHHREMENVWGPVIEEWTPAIYWLGGNVEEGENLVLTRERAEELFHAIDATERYGSRSLKRDLIRTRIFIRSHTGQSIESMRSELFDSLAGLSGARGRDK